MKINSAMPVTTTLLMLFLAFSSGSCSGKGDDQPVPGPEVEIPSVVVAFPGAEGGGMYATGGRGGKVLYVTKLDDDGSEGTLRWALRQKYPRIVMFKVSGIITLTSKITVNYGDLTIAGQSAPGDGICISGYTLQFKGADNVIVRYLRCRLGDQTKTEDDAMGGQYNSNMIVDHCSMSWSTDECASFYGNVNFTLQWCLLTESLRNSVHEKGGHGYGGIWGGKDASFHHNLLSCHDSRNPRLDHSFLYSDTYPESKYRGNVDLRNNVVYNFGNNNCYGGEAGNFNMINNYYKKGPASKDRRYFVNSYGIYSDSKIDGGAPHDLGYPNLYLRGNYYVGNPDGINDDQQLGIYYDSKGGHNKATCVLAAELPILGTTSHTITHTAGEAFDKVLKYSGASLKRDAVDARAVNDARNGTATITNGGNGSTGGIIDTQVAVGGWPVYNSSPAPADTDGDGIPDAWEDAHGLKKNDASDGAKITLDCASGYTNLEIYLNSLVTPITEAQK